VLFRSSETRKAARVEALKRARKWLVRLFVVLPLSSKLKWPERYG
jgi:hypothetical protein